MYTIENLIVKSNDILRISRNIKKKIKKHFSKIYEPIKGTLKTFKEAVKVSKIMLCKFRQFQEKKFPRVSKIIENHNHDARC